MLDQTLAHTRARETARFGAVYWPVPWWPQGRDVSYCVGWQSIQLGLRDGDETAAFLAAHRHLISISAFRAHYQWPEVPSSKIQPGDLVISNWTGRHIDGTLEAEHMEWAYSTAHATEQLVIVGANTGPAAGKAEPNGIWKKDRPIDGHILFGIRPPYKQVKPSLARRHEVKTVAVFLNIHVPAHIPRTTASGPGPDTGLEGRNYWRLVQTWGRAHGYYPSGFVIDGIPGPQSRICEAAAYKAARAKQ